LTEIKPLDGSAARQTLRVTYTPAIGIIKPNGPRIAAYRGEMAHASKLFGGPSDETLEREVAPGKNRLIYLLGHLLAVSDTMCATLRLEERLHPEYDAMFLKSSDRAVTPIASAEELKAA